MTAQPMTAQPAMVWYVSYGSNMCAARLLCYLRGGVPSGARRGSPGGRDRGAPRADVGWQLSGGVYFATESPVWGGGRAFYDPARPGPAAARAYLITAGQFADIAAQEMYRAPGFDLDLCRVRRMGRVELGPGRYETLLYLGDREGHPMLTCTAPWAAREVRWTAPSGPYLRLLAAGLQQAHAWDADRVAGYLSRLPGARGHWHRSQIVALIQPEGG
jgi:hypothetical protein